MTERLCLVHYHEIGLKGKNRSTFENQLVTNLHRALRGRGVASISRISGHIAVETEDRRASEELAVAIRRVPGVARVSLAYKCGLDEAEYCAAAVRALGEAGEFETFKAHARRSSTTYERHSLEMNQIVGAALCEAFPQKKVDVHHPDVTVVVHVVQGEHLRLRLLRARRGRPSRGDRRQGRDAALERLRLPGGHLDGGSQGRHLRARALLGPSHDGRHERVALPGRGGGPRAPPASWAGSTWSPSASASARSRSRCPRGCASSCTAASCSRSPSASRSSRGAKALVTGESLGQVASQTLENIAAVNEAVRTPVLRPLIGSDKQEIIARAHEIGDLRHLLPDGARLLHPLHAPAPGDPCPHGRGPRGLGRASTTRPWSRTSWRASSGATSRSAPRITRPRGRLREHHAELSPWMGGER